MLLTLVAAAACASEASDVPAVTVYDSAGIRIVENHVHADAVPTYAEVGGAGLEIGVVDGDPAYSLSSVIDVRTLPDGGIIVVEGGSLLGGVQELRLFDASGGYVRTIGRPGEGPGEFGRLAPLAGLAGDTIWTWDMRQFRLTWFTTEGDVLGDMQVQSAAGPITGLTRLADGTYLAALLDFSAANGADEYYVGPEPLVTFDAAGQPLDSLHGLGGIDMFVSWGTDDSGRGTAVMGPVPMGRRSSYATGRDRVYTGWNGEYRVVARSLDGAPVMVILAPGLERGIDPAEVDALRARRLASCSTEECQRNLNGIFDDLTLPDMRPAFSAMKVDALGNLWVAEYEPTDDPATGWHVFSPDGELLGHVSVPPGLRIHEIGSDHLLGVEKNELDVPFVKRLPLRRLQ
jgi:hypothetical protein